MGHPLQAGLVVSGHLIDAGGNHLEVKYAVIDAASAGDNEIVAAVATKRIRVLSLLIDSAGAVTARFESGAGGTALTGQMSLVNAAPLMMSYNPHGLFQTAAGAALNLELSGAVSVDGCLTYVEV